MYLYTYMYICEYMYIYIHSICIYIHIYIYICMYAGMQVQMYVCMYTSLCISIYLAIYLNICIFASQAVDTRHPHGSDRIHMYISFYLSSEKDSEAVLGVWRPAPLQTSRAPPYRARFGRWREKRFGRASMFDLAV